MKVLFIVLLLLSATYIDAQTFTRANNLFAGNFSNEGIQVNAQGDIYVFGYFYGSISLGNVPNVIAFSSPSYQFYVAKFDKNQNLLWAKATQGPAIVPVGSIQNVAGNLDASGNIYLSSMIAGGNATSNTKIFGVGEQNQTTITGAIFTGGLQGTFF